MDYFKKDMPPLTQQQRALVTIEDVDDVADMFANFEASTACETDMTGMNAETEGCCGSVETCCGSNEMNRKGCDESIYDLLDSKTSPLMNGTPRKTRQTALFCFLSNRYPTSRTYNKILTDVRIFIHSLGDQNLNLLLGNVSLEI